jgi:putative ABC transport system permease protein
MKRHLLKLIWNRKRSNALVVAEIFVSFIVLFIVLAFGLHFASNYRKPLGYDYAGVWRLEVAMHPIPDAQEDEAARRYESILAELERLDQVQHAAGVLFPPYFFGTSENVFELRGRPLRVHTNEGTDNLAEVLGFDLLSGRWFGPVDDAANWKPAVIDAELAMAVFGRIDVAGERLPFFDEEHRVVGVISDYRKGGELSSGAPYVFFRVRPGIERGLPPHLLLKMRPGTPVAFEEAIVDRLSSVAPGWSFTVQPLERGRESALRLQLIPLLLGATVAGFLILMVALGLTGIMWQTVTRRTREIGLRRAVGASARGVYGQIVFETVILAAAGVLLGLAVVVQLPLLGVGSFLGQGIYISATLLTSGTIILLAVACGLYPGWMASRVQPAEALRYE